MEARSFLRFAAAGAVATGVDMAVTLALLPWSPHYLLANSAGFIVANLIQFVIVHRWVFGGETRLSACEAYIATLGISLLGLLLSNVFVFLMVGIAGLHIVLAKLISAFATLIFNYGLRRALIYASHA